MTPFLPISDIFQKMIATLIAAVLTVDVWASLLSRVASLSSDERVALVKSIDLVVEVKADYFALKTPKKKKCILHHASFVTSQLVNPVVNVYALLNASNFLLFFNAYVTRLIHSNRQLSNYEPISLLLKRTSSCVMIILRGTVIVGR